MEINIKSIPHDEQRYETVGDWFHQSVSGPLHIRVSEMEGEPEDYMWLVALHELIEQRLCQSAGVSAYDVDKFDKDYEVNRRPDDDSEPGDSPAAPYRKQHLFATGIEKLLAAELGVDWADYERAINSL